MGQDKMSHQEGVVKVPIKYVNLWGLSSADESLFLRHMFGSGKGR